jgi:hypothetical protein
MLQRFLDDPLMWSGLRVGLLGVLGLIVANGALLTTRHGVATLGRWFGGIRAARWAKEDRQRDRFRSDVYQAVQLAKGAREFFGAAEPRALVGYQAAGISLEGDRFVAGSPTSPSQWKPGDVLRCRRNSKGATVACGNVDRIIQPGDLVRIAAGPVPVGKIHFAIEGGEAGRIEDFDWIVTLIELLIVVTIIGILMAFILRADRWAGSSARPSKKATRRPDRQARGRHDRPGRRAGEPAPRADRGPLRAGADLQQQFATTVTHPFPTRPRPAAQRAQVIAQYDMLRAELPDVFVVQAAPSGERPGRLPAELRRRRPGATPGQHRLPPAPGGQHPLPGGAAARSTYNFASYLGSRPQQANEIGITPQNTGVQPTRVRHAQIPVRGRPPADRHLRGVLRRRRRIYKQLGYGPQGTTAPTTTATASSTT